MWSDGRKRRVQNIVMGVKVDASVKTLDKSRTAPAKNSSYVTIVFEFAKEIKGERLKTFPRVKSLILSWYYEKSLKPLVIPEENKRTNAQRDKELGKNTKMDEKK